jgi:hypothetical protein
MVGGEMKIIYIAGRYRSSCEWGLEQFLREAEDAAIRLWSEGWAVICPHKNTAHFGGANGIPDEVWLKGDMEILSRCDALYLLDNWKDSSGAAAEFEYAISHGIPVRGKHWTDGNKIWDSYLHREGYNETNIEGANKVLPRAGFIFDEK